MSGNTQDIEYQELVRGIRDRSVAVVDVLSEKSFRAGHLPGARHLPLERLERLAPQVLPDPDARVVVYCGGPT